jgi:hypothetical protein
MKISFTPQTVQSQTPGKVTEAIHGKGTNSLMGFNTWNERKRHYYRFNKLNKPPGPQANVYICYDPNGNSFIMVNSIRPWLLAYFPDKFNSTSQQDEVIGLMRIDDRNPIRTGPACRFRLVRLPRRNKQGWYIPGYGNFDPTSEKARIRLKRQQRKLEQLP